MNGRFVYKIYEIINSSENYGIECIQSMILGEIVMSRLSSSTFYLDMEDKLKLNEMINLDC